MSPPLTYDIRALNFCGETLTKICHERGYSFPKQAPYDACRVAMGSDADLPLIQSMPTDSGAIPGIAVFGEAGFKAYMAATTIADYYCPAPPPPPKPVPDPVTHPSPTPAARPRGVPPPLPEEAKKGWKKPSTPGSEGSQKSALSELALTGTAGILTVAAGLYMMAAIRGGAIGGSLGGPLGAGIGIFAGIALTALITTTHSDSV